MSAQVRIEVTLLESVDADEDTVHELMDRLVELREIFANGNDTGSKEQPTEKARPTPPSSDSGSMGIRAKERLSQAKEARPQEEYREPFLRAMVDLGGRADRNDVFDLLEKRLDLSEADRAKTSSGATRWKKHVEWIASKMRPDRVKSPAESGWGIWELTDKGWNKAREMGLAGD